MFHIELPTNGMKNALLKVQEMPLPTKIRDLYKERLGEVRNMIVTDVQL